MLSAAFREPIPRRMEGDVAIRKETIRQQFADAAASELEPGERVIAGMLGSTGPSPWLSSAFGLLGVVVFALLGMRPYFMTVTDRRVLLMKASMTSNRPGGLAFADERSAVQVTRIKAGKVWSVLTYQRPNGKRLTLNVHRLWRDDMEAVAEALVGTTTSPTAYQ
jgi:hypothetical protein